MKTCDAADYANALLCEFGFEAAVMEMCDHPALAWRRAGLQRVCRTANGKSIIPPLCLTSAAHGALLALREVAEQPELLPTNGAALLGERARLCEFVSKGRVSSNGHCRLLDAADGRIAVNMARPDDWSLASAWLQHDVQDWQTLGAALRQSSVHSTVKRGREVGLPVAADEIGDVVSSGIHIERYESGRNEWPPLVVDMSSLWAGPLCGALLAQLGATVIKVESIQRPDGARGGNIEFYHLLNAMKKSVAFDFNGADDIDRLRKLLSIADIVIESSRPRALRNLGIAAEEILAKRPGLVWLSITAYGREENAVGFGDDVAVAAGLSSLVDTAFGEPIIVGDAIADPLTGIHGAFAAWACWTRGRGCMIDLSMRDVVKRSLGPRPLDHLRTADHWNGLAERDMAPFYAIRRPSGISRAVGADNAEVLARLC